MEMLKFGKFAALALAMAVIEQNLEILRELSIHGSGEMKALAIALLQAKGHNMTPDSMPVTDLPVDTPTPPAMDKPG